MDAKEVECKKEKILQNLSETIERFKFTGTICAEDGCNIIESLIFIVKYLRTDRYFDGCRDGFNKAIESMLQDIDKFRRYIPLNSVSGEICKAIRKKVEDLKGGEHESGN